ncbi:MAG TPA: chemotaxis protein CheB [Ramlibacter sp.]|jgi:two-component system chemotaxis response regulator CheB|nr:chemotaxis protein CheB [Ramlibacter sp.]
MNQIHAASVPMVGIGASAGGVEALRALFTHGPAHIEAAVMVVLHLPAHAKSQLDRVIGAVSALPVHVAQDGERVRPGHVYVATPDRHLLVEGSHIRLSRGPKESRVRPSVDALFRSMAVAGGRRVAGVVLSGALDDGTAGLWAIKEHGGVAFAQDPAEALHPSMPESAIEHVQVDGVAAVADLWPVLGEWSAKAAAFEGGQPPGLHGERHATEVRIADEANALQNGVMHLGKQSCYTCPDCHGVLVQIEEGPIVRYRCHTGHAFSTQTLLEEVDTAIDNGLWDTVRSMEERLLLLRQLGDLSARTGDRERKARLERLAKELEKSIKTLRSMVLDEKLFGHESEG